MIIILYIFLALLGMLLLLSLIAPKNYDVSRSVLINRPKSEVFEVLKSLKYQDTWSPWAKKDPNMKKEFRGVDGEVGSVSYWLGNKDVGEGEQEITKIEPMERIEGELRFLKPFKSTSNCYFLTTEEAGKTKVVWGFKGENKFPMNIMMLFMSMDKMVGKDFEEGLTTLKANLENKS